MGNSEMVERRSILKAAAVFGGLSTLAVIAPLFQGQLRQVRFRLPHRLR